MSSCGGITLLLFVLIDGLNGQSCGTLAAIGGNYSEGDTVVIQFTPASSTNDFHVRVRNWMKGTRYNPTLLYNSSATNNNLRYTEQILIKPKASLSIDSVTVRDRGVYYLVCKQTTYASKTHWMYSESLTINISKVRPTVSVEHSRRQSHDDNAPAKVTCLIENDLYTGAPPLLSGSATAPDTEDGHYATCDKVPPVSMVTHGSLDTTPSEASPNDVAEYAVAIPKSKRQDDTLSETTTEYALVVPKSIRERQAMSSLPPEVAQHHGGVEEGNIEVSDDTEYSTVVPKKDRIRGKDETESSASRPDGQRRNQHDLIYAELEVEGSPPLQRCQVPPPANTYSEIDFNTKAFVAPKHASPVP